MLISLCNFGTGLAELWVKAIFINPL